MSLTLAGAMLLGSGISAVGSLISNIFNRSSVSETNRTNAQIANDTNATNVALTREINESNEALVREENAITRAREDNAVRRAAADMEAAGLSKTLAAGSPASAVALSPATLQTPQVQPYSVQAKKWDSVFNKLNAADIASNIYKIGAEIDTQEALTKKYEAEANAQLIANGFAFENHKFDTELKAAQIDNYKSMSRANAAKANLDEIYGVSYADEIAARITKLSYESKYINMNIAKAKQEIKNLVKEEYGISNRNAYILEQIAESRLNQARMIHDLKLAKAGNYEFGQPTKLFGFPLGNAISNFNTYNGTQRVFIPDSNFNWID